MNQADAKASRNIRQWSDCDIYKSLVKLNLLTISESGKCIRNEEKKKKDGKGRPQPNNRSNNPTDDVLKPELRIFML
jgi:hypothetical protein